jgi:GTP cyclohydrolase I
MSTLSHLDAHRGRLMREGPGLDLGAAEQAAAALLQALCVPLTEHTEKTPHRMAAAYAELLTPAPVDLTTFPNDRGYDELVLVADIGFQSLCEHHMLPFVGIAHVGYLPGDRILGLSKFARLVDFLGRRPQTQERLTQEIAEQLAEHLQPRGVGVVMDAEHTCMTLRGVRAAGTRTVTSAVLGALREDPAARSEFLSLTRDRKAGR